MNGHRIGYVRVSSTDQNTARQLEGVPLDKVFTDHCSGKDMNRPQLALCLEFLREGDTLVVWSMDRLARNLSDLLKMVEDLTRRGIVVEFVKEHLSFTGDDSPMSMLMLSIMGGVAAFERAMIRERQAEGIKIAKAEGKYKGRKRSLSPAQVAELQTRLAAGESKSGIATALNISRETVYAYLRREKTDSVAA